MIDTHSEVQTRILDLQTKLKEQGIIAALIQKPRNLYYYTLTGQPSNLWVPAEGDPILFTRRVHELTREQTPIENVFPASNFKEMKAHLAEMNILPASNHYIGAEIDFLPYNLIKKLKVHFLTKN